MNKGNVIRSIFYGLIALILFTLGIMGIIYRIRITNTYKPDLEQIVKIFNSNSLIKEYRLHDNIITATYKGRKIEIKSEGVFSKEYTYYLKNGYLISEFNESDTLGSNILMILTDSISVNNGFKSGEIYSLFNKEELYNYKLIEGIEINKEEQTVKLSLTNPIYYIDTDNNEESNEPETDNETPNNNQL